LGLLSSSIHQPSLQVIDRVKIGVAELMYDIAIESKIE